MKTTTVTTNYWRKATITDYRGESGKGDSSIYLRLEDTGVRSQIQARLTAEEAEKIGRALLGEEAATSRFRIGDRVVRRGPHWISGGGFDFADTECRIGDSGEVLMVWADGDVRVRWDRTKNISSIVPSSLAHEPEPKEPSAGSLKAAAVALAVELDVDALLRVARAIEEARG